MEAPTLPPLDNRADPKTYSLFKDPVSDAYPDTYAADKANKMSLLLKEANPGTDILTNDIKSGAQAQWELVLKNQEDNKNLQVRNDLVRQIALSRDPSVPPTLPEVQAIDALSDDDLYSSDINTIYEKKYADLFTNTLTEHPENAIAQEAMAQDQEGALDVLDRAQFPLQRQIAYQDVVESMKAQYDDQSWGDFGADMAKMIIPMYTTYKQSNIIEVDGASWLPGNNIEDQASYLWGLPPAQFKVKLKEAVESLAKDNVPLAMSFLADISGQSEYGKLWNNSMPAVDVLTTLPVGALAKGMLKMGKNVLRPATEIPKIAAEAGFNRSAAIGEVTNDLLRGDIAGVTTIKRIEEVGDKLPSIFDPKKFLTGSTTTSAEGVARLRQVVLNNSSKILNTLSATNLVDRQTASQLARSVAEAQSTVKEIFASNTHNIIDTAVVAAEADRVTNTAVLVTKFGQRDGTLFQTKKQADTFARLHIGLRTNDFKVATDDLGGYYVEHRMPIPDVGDWRRANIETDLKSPDTLNGWFARKMRSPDYHLSGANTNARGVVVHGSEKFSQEIDEIMKPFSKLPKKHVGEIEDMMRLSQVNQKYFNTLGEFETAFYSKFQKVPTELQSEAYNLWRQLNDFDYMIRDAAVVKGYTTQGFQEIAMKVGKRGEEIKDEAYIGKVVDKLPPTDRKYRVRIVQKNEETHNFPSTMKNFEKQKEVIDNLLAQGYRIVEAANEPVYTIVKDFKRSSVKMKTLGYKEGGHFDPKYEHYISQGKFLDVDDAGSKVFTKDLNLGTAATQDQAKKIASLFDEARLKVKNKDPSAGKFIEDNLPISYAEFIKKVKTGDIDLDTPILARRSGQQTTDVFKYETIHPGYENYRYNTYNPMAEVNVRYGSERADTLLDVYAHDGKFAYKTNWNPLMNPLDALTSATRNMIDVRMLDDYTIKSANDWVQEFGHLLNVPTEALKANPRYYLQNPQYMTKIGTDKAEAARLGMLSLWNQLDASDVTRLSYRDKILNKMFDISDPAKEFDPVRLYTAKDAQQFLRAAAFKMKMGFWNPRQLFLQASASLNVVMISPRQGARALFNTPLTLYAMQTGDETVIRGLYNKMGKFSGWERDDFLQMVRDFKASGLASIGGDMAYLDAVSTRGARATLKNSAVGKAAGLLSSAKPFELGESFQRATSYSASWFEWRAANPGKIPDRLAQGRILQRSKDMMFNMSRDSNAAWQKGGASVMTQFYGYQARVAESLWDGGFLRPGKKFTTAEKLRLYAGMSTLYGTGTAVSMSTVFIPTTQIVKKWMAEAGIDPDDPTYDVFVDGAPSATMKAIFGQDLDFQSFGPTGLTTIVDLMNQDKNWADVMMGAGPGVIADSIGSRDNAASVVGLATAFGYSGFDVTAADLIAPLRNITTVDTVTKAIVAMNTGKYLSKKGNYVADVSDTEALMSAALGVQPASVADAYVQMAANKDYQENRQSALKEYESVLKKSTRALESGQDEDYETYRKRAEVIAIQYDLLPSERASIGKRVMFDTSLSDAMADKANDLKNKYETFSKDK